MPPTRMLVKTKSAPVDALGDRLAERDARRARPSAAATPPMVARRVLVDVVERDLVDRQIGARQPADEQRHADARAADDRDLHARPRRRPAPVGVRA